MHKKLTQKTIDALPPAEHKRYDVKDVLVPGLHIRVSNKGNKVWYVFSRVDRRRRRIKVGTYPTLGVADARERARATLREIELGTYDKTSKLVTLGDVIPQFIDLYARPRNRDWKGTERILKKFSSLNDTPLDKIKRADVVAVLDGIVASGAPTRANRALAAIKRLMSWCVDRGMLALSPVAGLRAPSKEVARDRVLSDQEVAAIWRASELGSIESSTR